MEYPVEQIIRMISRNGLRITEQRRSIARLFAEASDLLTPMQVYHDLGSKHRGLSYDTVYRNLKLLQEMGVLEPFYNKDGVKFGINRNSSDADAVSGQHHFVCMSCDIVYPFESVCASETPQLPAAFKAVMHRHEVLGYCPDCSHF
ncbi:Fur family transcriptional regulator [Cohnella luojiensis]|uniref:Transcriptional repressor n=1 Tax=Cohnella luojiensis TaxID=652876 RepID=A0A4Y8M2L1_9BACL|nr:transcriptional repressor [Cohnella luojiensis]TFE26915.1 transcriptional repressor [Cohnella luojiensis]